MSTFREDALAGEHMIISGGAGAIGVAIARARTAHGAAVTGHDGVEPAEANARLAAAGAVAGRTAYVQADLTQHSEVERTLRAADAAFGPVTAALCHAGMVQSGPLVDYPEALWDQTMALNLKAAFMLAQASARMMQNASIAGHLLFTTSWVGAVPWPEIGPYSASKAAMNMMMKTFARELAPRGIRSNAIAPGIVGVGMAKRQWDTEPEYRARASRAVPLGSLQTPESVADAVVFLCSPAASYMTGSILLVDGGCSLYPMD